MRIHYLTLSLLLTGVSFTSSANEVKKSTNDICHDEHSISYSRTKKFTPYETLQACLDSGGRLPKQATSSPKSDNTSTDYQRENFGHGWADFDKDCQNMRMETLIAHSTSLVTFKTEAQCRVISGRWISLFSGNILYQASKVDIDHVVSLKWAWENGANTWSEDKRLQFANDPMNLIPVEASLNRQKGAKGISQWLPPKNQCQYTTRFLRIIKRYDLKIPSIVQQAKYLSCKEIT